MRLEGQLSDLCVLLTTLPCLSPLLVLVNLRLGDGDLCRALPPCCTEYVDIGLSAGWSLRRLLVLVGVGEVLDRTLFCGVLALVLDQLLTFCRRGGCCCFAAVAKTGFAEDSNFLGLAAGSEESAQLLSLSEFMRTICGFSL